MPDACLKLHTLCLAALMAAASCGSADECGRFRAVDAEGWNYGDTLLFATPDSLQAWHGDIVVAVRHTSTYPYRNLWLEISVPGDSLSRPDTVSVSLASADGKWLGRGLGLSYQSADTVLRGKTITAPTVAVRHIMRTDKLRDIEQIGLIFFKKEAEQK